MLSIEKGRDRASCVKRERDGTVSFVLLIIFCAEFCVFLLLFTFLGHLFFGYHCGEMMSMFNCIEIK